MPARIRASTYARDCRSTTTDSTPSAASRCERSSPAGPAPMMATSVRMGTVNPPDRPAAIPASTERKPAHPGRIRPGRCSGRDAQAEMLRPMPCAATWRAATSRGRSRLRLGTTMPTAATTGPWFRRIGTATEQAPRLISSLVCA